MQHGIECVGDGPAAVGGRGDVETAPALAAAVRHVVARLGNGNGNGNGNGVFDVAFLYFVHQVHPR
jgi:hypothetical protein